MREGSINKPSNQAGVSSTRHSSRAAQRVQAGCCEGALGIRVTKESSLPFALENNTICVSPANGDRLMGIDQSGKKRGRELRKIEK